MIKILPLLFIFLPLRVKPQILPAEGCKLNFKLVGFSVPITQVSTNRIEIAIGDYYSVDSFKKNIVVDSPFKSNKMIIELPLFGRSYTWRIVPEHGGRVFGSEIGSLHHFDLQTSGSIDPNKQRLRILQPAVLPNDDLYISVETGAALYDMSGNVVWFLPQTSEISNNLMDMKFTRRSTITFLYGANGYEVNFKGDVLWKTPNKGAISGDTINGEGYHHEFTRLLNGHYMILGQQKLHCKSVVSKNKSYIITANGSNDQDGFILGKFGTIIEYDSTGHLVWSWRSSKYLIGSDFDDYESTVDTNKIFDPHDNAFFFDEKNKVIYLGFKALNRIIKIEYPSGKVLNTYGALYEPGAHSVGNGLFCNQHSIGLSKERYLYYFNNNSCNNTEAFPSVVMLKEPRFDGDSLKKVWEFSCVADGSNKRFRQGGNVIELQNGSMFVCMGSEYSELMIVNKEKKTSWRALPEKFQDVDNVWMPVHEYRANIISRVELEQMIWRSE